MRPKSESVNDVTCEATFISTVALFVSLGTVTTPAEQAVARRADPAEKHKRPIAHDVYDSWKSIQGTKLSRDGVWLACRAARDDDGDGDGRADGALAWGDGAGLGEGAGAADAEGAGVVCPWNAPPWAKLVGLFALVCSTRAPAARATTTAAETAMTTRRRRLMPAPHLIKCH